MNEWINFVIPVAGVVVPLAVGILLWWLNERSKLNWEKHIRKEDRYRGFLESIHGFYITSQNEEITSQNKERKDKFLQDLKLAWLYCPDDVIKAGNAFLETVATGTRYSNEEKERTLAEFVIACRRDLHGETELTVEDHRIWRST